MEKRTMHKLRTKLCIEKNIFTGGYDVVSPSGSGVVGIETFYNADDDAIPLLWPGGGVIPVVTTGAGKSDIYSFRTFDGGSTFYGVVGGQNFG